MVTELTILRKRINAFRGRYQRTEDENLRQQRKAGYGKVKGKYQIAIRQEKIRSWKE